MWGWAANASTTARDSGSLRGKWPASMPNIENGFHSLGKLRFRSRPNSCGALVQRTPSQLMNSPSSQTNQASSGSSSRVRGRKNGAHSGSSTKLPAGCFQRIMRTAPSPSMSQGSSPLRTWPSRGGRSVERR